MTIELTPGLYQQQVYDAFMQYAWFRTLNSNRMKHEIVLAHIYSYGPAHGTSGHLGYVTINELAARLNSYEAQSNAEEKQYGNFSDAPDTSSFTTPD